MATKQQRDRQRRALVQRTRELEQWKSGWPVNYPGVQDEPIRQAKIEIATNDVVNLQEKIGVIVDA